MNASTNAADNADSRRSDQRGAKIAVVLGLVVALHVRATTDRPGAGLVRSVHAMCDVPTPPPSSLSCDEIDSIRIRGVVLRSGPFVEEGPVARAMVAVTPDPWWPCPTAVTADDGAFLMDCYARMPCGCNRIVVSAPGYATWSGSFSSLTLERETLVVRLRAETVAQVLLPWVTNVR